RASSRRFLVPVVPARGRLRETLVFAFARPRAGEAIAAKVQSRIAAEAVRFAALDGTGLQHDRSQENRKSQRQ
ncbi:MAG: hypothetical protein ABSC22_20940, partial [Roseiarcus sp.]